MSMKFSRFKKLGLGFDMLTKDMDTRLVKKNSVKLELIELRLMCILSSCIHMTYQGSIHSDTFGTRIFGMCNILR